MVSQKAFKPSRTPYNNKQRAGFTLVEVIIVMALITILASVAFPMILDWLPNMRLKSAARDLYANMQETKIQAIKQNQEWAIVFDPGSNNYHICSDPGPVVPPNPPNWSSLSDNAIERTVDLTDYKSGITYGHGDATTPIGANFGGANNNNVSYDTDVLVFNPRGTGNEGYVYLAHEENSDSMAVGTLTSGVIIMSRWLGSWE